VPYDLRYTVSIYARTIEEASQIVEQILPIFNPQYNLNLELIPQMNITKSVPIILDDISNEIEYEGDGNTMRLITWDLNFTVKAMFYGPIIDAKVIKSANTNIRDADGLSYLNKANKNIVVLVLNTANSNGTFSTSENIYQGANFNDSQITADVIEFDTANKKLYISNITGPQIVFSADSPIRGVSSGASWTLNHYYVPSDIYAKSIITPNPSNALANSNYGYTIDISEYPNID
jgi:hypothetical protein